MSDLFDRIKAMAESSATTGEVKHAAISDTGWQPIHLNGKVVGRFRISEIEITITPKPARRPRKTAKKRESH